nr:MAG TPA: hypothetical protein [Caudoviricetes sp.]
MYLSMAAILMIDYVIEHNESRIYKASVYISVPQSLRLKLIFIQYNQRLEIFCGTDFLPWPCLD